MLAVASAIGVEAAGDEGRHVERVPDIGAGAANEGVPEPMSGLSCDRRAAGIAREGSSAR